MPQTDAENGNLAGKLVNQRHRDTGFVRRAGSGRDDDMIRLQFGNLGQINLVITIHLHILTQLAQILHQVIGEGIVVIYHQKHIATLYSEPL